MPAPAEMKTRPIWLDAAALALLGAATLKIMANATISPALPALAARFAQDPQAELLVRFLVAAPSLAVVLVAPFAGLAADRFGRERLLFCGVLLFALAGSAGAWLPDLNAILVSRLVLGIAVALTMTSQVALVGDVFSGERRNGFLGLQTAAINFSGFVYIGAAGVLAGLSPRLPFLIYLLPLLIVPLLGTVGARAGATPQGAPLSGSNPGATPGAKGTWLPQALGTGLLTMATVMLFFQMPSQLPFYLEGIGLDGASDTAIGLGALTLTGGFVAISYGRISRRTGLTGAFVLGFLGMAAGFCVLGTGSGAGYSALLPGCALVGAGYALVQPGLLQLALKIAPDERRGAVSGIVTTSMFLGQVVSPLALTPIIESRGFGVVFLGAGGALVLLGVAAVALVTMAGRRSRIQRLRGFPAA